MTEKTLTPVLSLSNTSADEILEQARIAHEKYLIKQQDSDLEKAIECYVDAIKTNPMLSESYYRLASLLLIKGQITVEGALEQCKTAVSLEPNNPNAHIYTGYFQCLNGNYKEAEKEFAEAIETTESDIIIDCNHSKILRMGATILVIIFALLCWYDNQRYILLKRIIIYYDIINDSLYSIISFNI